MFFIGGERCSGVNDATIAPKSSVIGRETQSASEAVVDAVAEAKGVSTLDVHPPLYEAVDPDALDELVTSMSCLGSESAGHVTFHYSGYEVVVTGSGEVSITETELQE